MSKRNELLEIAKDSVSRAKIALGRKAKTAGNFNDIMMENLDGVVARIEKILNSKSEEELAAKFDLLKKKFSETEIANKAHSETYNKVYFNK